MRKQTIWLFEIDTETINLKKTRLSNPIVQEIMECGEFSISLPRDGGFIKFFRFSEFAQGYIEANSEKEARKILSERRKDLVAPRWAGFSQ